MDKAFSFLHRNAIRRAIKKEQASTTCAESDGSSDSNESMFASSYKWFIGFNFEDWLLDHPYAESDDEIAQIDARLCTGVIIEDSLRADDAVQDESLSKQHII